MATCYDVGETTESYGSALAGIFIDAMGFGNTVVLLSLV